LALKDEGGFFVAGGTIWTGYIHFRETNVPVKLHPAVKENRIQFHLLHRRDKVRLLQQMICATHEKVPVPTEEQAKGFELEEGKYLLVDPAELEAAEPERSRLIEVHEFVQTAQIDPIYLDRVYYLEPDTLVKEYNALAGAMQKMEVAGICTWAIRKRAYLGALQARGKLLRLNTLRYADEVVAVKSLDLPKFSFSEKELELGSELINRLSVPFQPEKFANEHQKKLQNLLDQKARGEIIAIRRPRLLRPTAPDKLVEALEASLKKVA
jgi:DNA end-binding protein Ku